MPQTWNLPDNLEIGGKFIVSCDHFILKLQFDFNFTPIFIVDKCLLKKEQALGIVVVRKRGKVGTFHINIPHFIIKNNIFSKSETKMRIDKFINEDWELVWISCGMVRGTCIFGGERVCTVLKQQASNCFLSLSEPNFINELYYGVVSHTETYTETRARACTHTLSLCCLSVCLLVCLSVSLC